ncbi:MAG: leucine-rich repeat protein [Blautia sp.]|nr:leucine-rich repeat protein [Lachnoclostridium sp.]MCM1212629.1 leucine-rich repeat protein [Blautia sp.]
MKKTGKFRRGMAILLSAFMVVSILPQNNMQIFAAEKAVESSDAFQIESGDGSIPVLEEEISDNTGESEEQENFSEEDSTTGEDTEEELPVDENETEKAPPIDGNESGNEEDADIGENDDSEEIPSEEGDEEDVAEPDKIDQNTATETAGLFGMETRSSDADFVITDGVLTGYNGTATELIIPDGVTKIGDNFLKDNQTVTSVVFSAGVEEVGNYAFRNCTALDTVTLNEGLVKIGSQAFEGAAFGKKLSTGAIEKSSLTIPGTVQSIGTGAFHECAYLREILFEDGETITLSIDGVDWQKTFADCESLERVVLPKRLKTLPQYTFYKCANLKEVTLQEGLVEIGNHVFEDCPSLEEILFPSTVTTVGDYAFRNCTGLKMATLNEGLATIGSQAFECAAFGRKLSTGAIEKSSLTIPGTVQSIGTGAFHECAYLRELIFADGETAILTIDGVDWQKTFADCESLERVVLPKRLQTLPQYTFQNCANLKEVTLQEGLVEIGNHVFENCSSLDEILFPSTVTTVRDYAFRNCTGLRKATLNEGLITIGSQAFECAAFGKELSTGTIEKNTLTIPSTVQTIGTGAFHECAYLRELIFADGETVILTIDGVDWLKAFADCESLERLVLPKRLKTLPQYTFQNCANLKEVTLQEGLEEIGNHVFENCPSLEEIVFPSTVTSVGDYAFRNCTGLRKATLNEGLITINSQAFEGAAFGRKLSTGAIEKNTLTIPSTVQTIGTGAFHECAYLREVIFADGETVILKIDGVDWLKAFADCENLERVILPARLQTIPKHTFYNCAKLNAIYIPASVTQIDAYVLLKCPKLVIYGEPGSTAEQYAKANGIAFKNKSNLKLSVENVSLDRKTITKAGASAIGQTVQLTATILPDSAQNKAVSYTSSNEETATVNNGGLITITGYGKATITVTTKDGGKQASCIVSVLRQWTAEELDEIKTALQTQNQSNWTVVTNRLTSISDLEISLPSGAEYTAEWNLDYDVETGRNDHYNIRIRQAGYQDAILRGFTVTGVTLESLTVSASNQKVEAGKELTLTAEPIFNDSLPDGVNRSTLYRVEWKSANTSLLSIKSTEQATDDKLAQAVIGGVKKASNVTVTATLILLDQNRNPLPKDAKKKGITWFETSVKISVLSQPVTDRIVITAHDDQNQPVELSNLRALLCQNENTVYQLNASVYAGETSIPAPTLTWKSSNTALATVTNKGAAVTLTVKKNTKGSAVISATEKDSGYVEKFRIVVKDSTPRLEETKVTFNLYKETLQETVHLLPSDGYQIKADSLSILNKDGTPSAFEIKKSETETDSYYISVKSGQQVTKGKQNLLLSAITSAEEQTPHQIPFTIQAVKTAPKLTIKQEAIELYRKDARGTVYLSSSEEIESIQYTSSAAPGNPMLVQKDANPADGTFTFGLENATTGNYKNAGAKGKLLVKFKGYTNEASYNKALTLSVNKKLPTIKAVADHSVLYPKTALNTTTVRFYDKDGNELSNGITVEQDGNAPKKTGVTLDKDTQGYPKVQVQALEGAANRLTVKWKIGSADWYEPVKVSCVIQTQKATALSFENSALNLNTAYDLENYEPVSTLMFLKGFEDDEIISITVSGANKNATAAQNALMFGQDGNRLTVGIQDAAYFKKAGTYQYNVRAILKDSLTVEGKIKIAIKKGAATASLKAKGSINLLDRTGTNIVYTPVLNNYTDRVVSADLYGERAGSFNCIYHEEDGKIYLYAKSGVSLKRNTAYKLKVSLTLASGVKLVVPVTVKLQQKAVKLQKSVDTITLFESVNKEVCKKDIAFSVKDTDNIAINDIKLVNDYDTFTYEYDSNGAGKIWVSDIPSGKVNKKYTLKFAVTFQDGAGNAAPVYVTVKVDYRK